MDQHERALLTYLKLAEISHQRGQFGGRDKLLLLTAAESCRAGLLQYAETCRELILNHNPRHALSLYNDFVEAMKSDEFQELMNRTEHQLSFERAEFLLEEQGDHSSSLPNENSIQQIIESLLEMMTDSID